MSRTGRVRQIGVGDKRIATVRANDGFLILSVSGGQKLKEALPFPKKRVIVNDDAAPFVAKGKTAFAKHIVDCDPELRARMSASGQETARSLSWDRVALRILTYYQELQEKKARRS